MLSEPVGNVNGSDLLTRKGYLIEERGMSYLTETDPVSRSGPCKRRPAPTASRSGPGGARKY